VAVDPGDCQPADGLPVVSFHTGAGAVELTEDELGLQVAPDCRFSDPFGRSLQVPAHAGPVQIKQAELVLRPRVAQTGGAVEQFGGLLPVGRDAVAPDVYLAEEIGRVRVALVDGPLQPFAGQPEVPGDALAAGIDQAQVEFCARVALAGTVGQNGKCGRVIVLRTAADNVLRPLQGVQRTAAEGHA